MQRRFFPNVASARRRSLLESQLASGARDTETYFLLGLIEVEKQQYRKAIGWFRLALAREPSSARLRLELGRAFYLARDSFRSLRPAGNVSWVESGH
jgi:cytochrome c-type biogenesis protein CcmH/NrfG